MRLCVQLTTNSKWRANALNNRLKNTLKRKAVSIPFREVDLCASGYGYIFATVASLHVCLHHQCVGFSSTELKKCSQEITVLFSLVALFLERRAGENICLQCSCSQQRHKSSMSPACCAFLYAYSQLSHLRIQNTNTDRKPSTYLLFFLIFFMFCLNFTESRRDVLFLLHAIKTAKQCE